MSVGGVNRGIGVGGVNRGIVGVNRGLVGAGVVRPGNIGRVGALHSGVLHHRPFFRNRLFFAGGFGYGYGLGYSCLRYRLTPVGWTWVNVCAYPDYSYYY
jgi:hypothetical protein